MFKIKVGLIFLFFYTGLTAQIKAPFRIIHFAGLDWYVRNGTGNPDHNIWNDSPQSVWVDAQHRLHLKIHKENGQWTGAEVRSIKPAHYGQHRFYVSGRVDLLDKNVVAGLFLYKTYLKEMDIEFSKWGQAQALNAQYVVQPEIPENTHKFKLHLQGQYSTHTINWQANQIDFLSVYGHYLQAPDKNYLIDQWTYNKKQLLDDQQYYIHINLWLTKQLPPSDQKSVELIITSLDTPISPITITSHKAYKDLNIYPNFDKNTIYIQSFDPIESYELYDYQNYLITAKDILKLDAYINTNFLNKGQYRLLVKTQNDTYEFLFQKNY